MTPRNTSTRPNRHDPLPDFEPEDFFVLRSPLLPFEEYDRWMKAASTSSGDQQTALEHHLLGLARRPEIAEALFVASPSLSEGLEKLGDAADANLSAKKTARLRDSLTRYLSRMMTRSTPFGLFAGGSLGALGDHTRLTLEPRRQNRRHTRLDMDYLYRLAGQLETDHGVRPGLTYAPNSSLYRAAGRWRYAEGRLDGRNRSYHLVAVRDDKFLSLALEAAKHGTSLHDIARALVDADLEIDGDGEDGVESEEGGELELEEAEEFVQELIDAQILVSDLGPRVTGPEPIHDLIERLSKIPKTEPIAACLEDVRDALRALDAGSKTSAPDAPSNASLDNPPLDNPAEIYRRLGRSLEPLGTEVQLPRLFQVDMSKPAPGLQLGPQVIVEIKRAVAFLYRLRGPSANDPLTTFRQNFQRRYESGRSVPLVEVLDEEVGIGFERSTAVGSEPSPLLQGLRFPPSQGTQDVPWNLAQDLITKKLFEATRQGHTELVLTDNDLDRLGEAPQKPLPDALQIMCSILASSPEAIDQGNFRLHFKNASGPSGAGLLGRFCHGDEALSNKVRQHLQREASHHPNVAYAEVVHLPEGRIGNILLRPVLRDYEIPFLGQSGAPSEQQIPITDLLVSVVGEEVVLWSQRLGKRVIPRLTSAHNYSLRGLGIYRFLCSLQYQNLCSGFSWSWGPFETLPQLPRVVYGRTILRPAEWFVAQRETDSWCQLQGSRRQQELAAWREQRTIPRRVLLADGDNELLVDFGNPLAVDAFLAIVKRRPSFRLLEFLQDAPNLVVQGAEGHFAHEIILPMARRARQDPEPVNTAQRTFLQIPESIETHLPGSQWLYAKLYTGSASADDILQGPVQQLVQRYGSEIQSWFFIRYADPDFHLRLRFRVRDLGLRLDLQQRLSELSAHLLRQGLIWDLQLATYQPEIERYGGPEGLPLCEQIFRADSEAILAMLPHLRGDVGAELRWLATLASVDRLLESLFDGDLVAKTACVENMQQGFATEFRVDKAMRQALSQKLRDKKALITMVLRNGKGRDPLPPNSPLAMPLTALELRRQRLQEPMAELSRLAEARRLTVPLVHLGSSLAHMTVNRLIPAEARAHEVVLYDFLHRHLMSQRARQRALDA